MARSDVNLVIFHYLTFPCTLGFFLEQEKYLRKIVMICSSFSWLRMGVYLNFYKCLSFGESTVRIHLLGNTDETAEIRASSIF
jgi:hypothetical protein